MQEAEPIGDRRTHHPRPGGNSAPKRALVLYGWPDMPFVARQAVLRRTTAAAFAAAIP
ncbi:hypothetical protein [Streptomyces bullii]|uniref:Uncharacterized protein n=1 Tax=Streptomyces bullii TaxID=349910 RepID=A0ABW0V5B4_9ACTN